MARLSEPDDESGPAPSASAPAERIVAAADECYARLGMEATTTELVAHTAGVSRATVYRHFQTREDLTIAVLEHRTRQLLDQTREHVATWADVDTKLVEGVLHLVERARHDPVLQLLVTPARLQQMGRLDEGSRLAAAFNTELWSPIFQRARERGEIDERVDVAGLCHWLIFIELIMVSRLDRAPSDDAPHRATLHDMVVPALHRR